MWISDKDDGHNNSNEPVPLSVAPHFPDAFQFPQNIYRRPFITQRERDAEQVLFTMRGHGSLGYWYNETIYSSYCHCNDNDESSEEELIEVSLGEKIRVHRSLETRHCYSSNIEGRENIENRYKDNSHYTSINYKGPGHRLSMNIHSSSCGGVMMI